MAEKKVLKCPICGSDIKYLYNDGGRKVIILSGIIKLYTCYYSCVNEDCEYNQPHSVFQNLVLPYKHFGLDVWRWAIIDYVEFHDPYTTISRCIHSHFRVKICPNSVKSIIETFLAANSDHAISETNQLVKKNGKIFLMLDGQRPNKKEHMLWIFIDTLTDRIIHMEYLVSANSKTISGLLLKIQNKYGVPIKTVISDHQSSIIKAVKDTLPGIPHQYCHFHFLKNLSRNIGSFDSHLHVELVKDLNKLAYYELNTPDTQIDINDKEYNLKNIISMILEDVKRLANRQSRDFDFFNGIELYNDLEKLIERLDKLRDLVSNNNKGLETILKIKTKIRNTIKRGKKFYKIVKRLVPIFNEIRAIFAQYDKNSNEIKKRADEWADKLKQIINRKISVNALNNLK
ncbi:MAG: transposase [Candidatus Helarchaeota archaeon]